MNWANRITVLRILLVPLFVAMLHYFRVSEPAGAETYRFLAIVIFVIGVITDALDGFIARNYNQKSRLGIILDPIADKLLLISAVIILTFPSMAKTSMNFHFPYWYAVLVITRDALIIAGSLLMWIIVGDVNVKPSMLGKVTTFLQMTAVIWLLFIFPRPLIPVYLATLFTVVSGIGYLLEGAKQAVIAEEDAGRKK